MIALIQRVTEASVTVDSQEISRIAHGFVVLLGIFEDDTQADANNLVQKVINMRIMSDSEGKMNKSILETKGEILLVSQFTLCADLTFGRRPSFIKAMAPEKAHEMYLHIIKLIEATGLQVKTGQFGTYMDVEIHNDGPVTIIVDTKKGQ